jgi:hypothetical protein
VGCRHPGSGGVDSAARNVSIGANPLAVRSIRAKSRIDLVGLRGRGEFDSNLTESRRWDS